MFNLNLEFFHLSNSHSRIFSELLTSNTLAPGPCGFMWNMGLLYCENGVLEKLFINVRGKTC